MGLAVQAAVGAAREVGTEVLELRGHGARGGVEHRSAQGDEALHDLRSTSHDAQAVGHETERALIGLLHLFESVDLVEREGFESRHGSLLRRVPLRYRLPCADERGGYQPLALLTGLDADVTVRGYSFGPNATDRRPAVSKVKTRTADQPLRRLLIPAAVLSLSAAFVVGAGAVSAQDDSIDGTWTVDTSIGDIGEGSSTFVGFRVAEVLDPGGDVIAVGRTPDVSGQLEVAGTVIESFAIEADLTTLATDNNFRNGAIARTLQTGDFPTASFVSTEPVDLGQVPPEGEVFNVSVPGTLTIRDISQDIVVDLEAGRSGDTVVVVGTWPIEFGDFEVTMPSAPIVVSVSESGELEWQVFFTREGEMAADDRPTRSMAADPTEGESSEG